jgi:selenium metabolism protein YedF
MKTIDCRGLACPQPVMVTKKALDDPEGQEILVLVDNPAARENVSRFAGSQGCQVDVTDEKGYFAINIRKGDPAGKKEGPSASKVAIQGELVFFIDSDSLGRGSEELGSILMRAFLHTLAEADIKPQKLILANSGVKLACEGSPALEDLQLITSQGVEILACGTCLSYFELKDKLKAGRISNMYEILNTLSQAGRTVKI